MLAEKSVKCKAAETHGLLGFVVQTLERHKDRLITNRNDELGTLFQLLYRAGQAAEQFDAVLSGHDRNLPVMACEELFTHYSRFILLCCRAGVPMLPKAHLMFHCIHRAREKGNPRTYSTYIDESYNGAIAKVCRSVHRSGWAHAVYRKLEMLEALFESRVHLAAILSFVAAWSGPRCVHFFDFFSGLGQGARTFSDRGYELRLYDIETDASHDATTEAGFYRALEIVLSLCENALILSGPPCSLWVFMSQPYHRRTLENPIGDVSKEAVRLANCLVRNVTLLLSVAHFRKRFFVLEQPSFSRMQSYPYMALLCEELRLRRVHTWLRCFGHFIPKPTYVLSNMVDEASALKKIWSKKRSFEI